MKFLEIEPDTQVDLASPGNLPERVHVFDQDSIDAVNAALAARRPLLIRGEPGIGKSQLARAAAKQLRRSFIQFVVDAHCESRDLLWYFDAVQRLADAQLSSALNENPNAIKERLDIDNYLHPGPLWWAFDWDSAKEQAVERLNLAAPPVDEGCDPENGCVILIDEIDKAEMDVPNGLLEALGDAQFMPMGRKEPVVAARIPPLVIITTNEERALPNAFLRRCLVLQLRLFDGGDALARLVRRGRAHFEQLDQDTLTAAAELLLKDRKEAEAAQQQPLPGQAEYLDMLRAVDNLAPGDKERQLTLLKEVARFVVKKQADASS